MAVQKCISLENDLAFFVHDKKLPLSWFVNVALREYLSQLKEFQEYERETRSKS